MPSSEPSPLATHEALMQFLYQAPIGLVQTDLDGAIEIINPTAARLLMPLSLDGGLDNIFQVLHPAAPEMVAQVQAFDGASGVICEGLQFCTADLPTATAARAAKAAQPLRPTRPGHASTRRAEQPASQVLSLSVMKLDAQHLMIVLDDVSDQVQQQRRLLELSVHDAQRTDSLTQMPNRAAMRERLASVLAAPPAGSEHGHRPPFALLFLNCDRFKQVNDLLGPAGGDDLLQLMAKRLMSALRQEDLVAAPAPGIELARVGGDEFVVLLCGVADRNDALGIGHRLVHALGQPYRVAAQAVTCSVSVGLLWWDGAASLVAQGTGNDADALLRDTGLAMVQAKRLGGGQCALFEPDMRESAQRRSSLEADLRAALQGQQLFVAYQPVVSLQAGAASARCVGVEALVRWRHPVRGFVPPQDFIALAEACGLIDAIGDFVLDTALRHQRDTMQRLGPAAPAWTAVNLSRAQLRQRSFVDKVRDGLLRHDLQAKHLHLEVTESLAAQDPTVQAALGELRALGICLALDDFGTGYSSLSSLHQLPVQVVKIDRSFTNQVDTSTHHRVLVEATVKVARSLGMLTVVEGIETTAQAAILQALGCDMGQGYLYGKALSSEELHDWLAHAAMQDASA